MKMINIFLLHQWPVNYNPEFRLDGFITLNDDCFTYDKCIFITLVASELLILSLDLVKNRVGVMSLEMRKSFIGQILVGLIEKTTDSKVMKAITKMVEDWVKTKVCIVTESQYEVKHSNDKKKQIIHNRRNYFFSCIENMN